MNRLRCALLVLSTTVATLGQSPSQSQKALSPRLQARAVTRSLYQQVVARFPGGLPDPEKMRFLLPILAKRCSIGLI